MDLEKDLAYNIRMGRLRIFLDTKLLLNSKLNTFVFTRV